MERERVRMSNLGMRSLSKKKSFTNSRVRSRGEKKKRVKKREVGKVGHQEPLKMTALKAVKPGKTDRRGKLEKSSALAKQGENGQHGSKQPSKNYIKIPEDTKASCGSVS